MNTIPAIAIFDIGKTNKKLLLFDDQYKLVYEKNQQLPETTDEDGYPCEDVAALTKWVDDSFHEIFQDERFAIKAVNVSAYGASFVYLDEDGKVMLPLYNYLKPYSRELLKKFYAAYGGESLIGKQTASPALGNLNSGLQLYRLKYEQPEAFAKIKFALHLPQYISYILSSKINSDITSIGCHTYLWNFRELNYHRWVHEEKIDKKLPPLKKCSEIAGYTYNGIPVGIGLHDSSAALIPYLISFNEPFILLSTGTWCISLNPFNNSMLTEYELKNDCLCYLTYEGKPVKASRLFAGHEHEEQIKILADNFNKDVKYYTTVLYNYSLVSRLQRINLSERTNDDTAITQRSVFGKRSLGDFKTYEEAYHQLMLDIVSQQYLSTQLVLKGSNAKRIFVDGGFSKNSVYMNLLAAHFPGIEVFAASMAQATAVGAALSIHNVWNRKPVPNDIIELKYFSSSQNPVS